MPPKQNVRLTTFWKLFLCGGCGAFQCHIHLHCQLNVKDMTSIKINYPLSDGFYFEITGDVFLSGRDGWAGEDQAIPHSAELCDGHPPGLITVLSSLHPSIIEKAKTKMIEHAKTIEREGVQPAPGGIFKGGRKDGRNAASGGAGLQGREKRKGFGGRRQSGR